MSEETSSSGGDTSSSSSSRVPPNDATREYLRMEQDGKLQMHTYWSEKLERAANKKKVTFFLLLCFVICISNTILIWNLETNIQHKMDKDQSMIFDKLENLTKEIKENNQFEYMFVKKRTDRDSKGLVVQQDNDEL